MLYKKKRERKKQYLWTMRISLFAFCISLILSFVSEFVLKRSNLIIAIVLLTIFMAINVFSDMVGLAITSCQCDKILDEKISDKLKNKCLLLIRNSDKVSSILCDVIGDICGILCGVSGAMIATIFVSLFSVESAKILFAVLISSLIAGLTVFFKSIYKNYAINNSLEIIKKSGKFLLFFENIFNFSKFKK